jgi:hypothetical protein
MNNKRNKEQIIAILKSDVVQYQGAVADLTLQNDARLVEIKKLKEILIISDKKCNDYEALEQISDSLIFALEEKAKKLKKKLKKCKVIISEQRESISWMQAALNNQTDDIVLPEPDLDWNEDIVESIMEDLKNIYDFPITVGFALDNQSIKVVIDNYNFGVFYFDARGYDRHTLLEKIKSLVEANKVHNAKRN